MSTPVFRNVIDHPSAWTFPKIGGREAFTHRLGREHVEAIDELLAKTRNLPAASITCDQFSNEPIDALMAAARAQVMDGHGAIILSGLDMSRYDLGDYERIVWGLGTHLGKGVVQSPDRDIIAHVAKQDNPKLIRGYTGDFELGPHGDFHEVMCLATFSKAESGGESGLVSNLAIHNAILEQRPELLTPLYEGFYQESLDTTGVTETKVPVYCNVDGKVSCYMHIYFTYAGAAKLGTTLPEDLLEGLKVFREQAQRPDLWARFMLEPGEMLFWHNFVNLHSRTAFKDSEQNRRLLLRLWLNVPDGRPMVPEFSERRRYMDIEHAKGLPGMQYLNLGVMRPPAKQPEPVPAE